jgi:DNA mismatch repair protein MutL
MTNKINILDIDVAEKIAAGEVVEKPFCAVKELVENSIDAGADKITIDIQDRGVDLIKITDNGSGMSKDDLKICILRHATSKIKTLDDLEKIRTMGFRGEALSAISRVSRLEIKTKQATDETGHSLYTEGGSEPVITKTGIANGTQIIVKDLFYNTPARKKFLKSPTTEHSHIISSIEKIAIAHNNISFQLNIDGKNKLNLIKTKNKLDRISDIFGKNISENLIPFNFENNFLRIYGYTSKPELVEKSKNNYYSFVNDRIITSKVIFGGINEAYKENILKSRYPVSFIFLELEGTYFDVNVHPQKTEIKFINEPAIFSIIKDAISIALKTTKNNNILTVETPNSGVSKTQPTTSLQPNTQRQSYKQNPQTKSTVFIPKDYKEKYFEGIKKIHSLHDSESKNYTAHTTKNEVSVQKDLNENQQKNISQNEHLFVNNDEITVVGWLPDKFILAYNFKKDLLIIDQHAGDERINYEILRKDFENKMIEVQGLLLPEMVEIQNSKIDLVIENIKNFERFGFFVEHFGDNSFKITAIPSIIQKGKERSTFLEIVENIIQSNDRNILYSQELIDKIIMTACKNSIKANQKLSFQEMQELIKRLFKTSNPYHCPHGRPTIILFNEKEIDKKFGRINV